MPTITLAMIVRDEADQLPSFLKCTRAVWNELIAVDTGSSDTTRELLTAAGALVIDTKWNRDFSAARNLSLEHATGDWVLVLDADERITPEFIEDFRAMIQREDLGALALQFSNHLPYGHHHQSSAVRAFRRDAQIRFIHPVGEDASSSVREMLTRRGLKLETLEIPVGHLGAVRSRTAATDHKLRDAEILSEHPHDLTCQLKLLELARAHQDEVLWKNTAHAVTDRLELAGRENVAGEPWCGQLVALIAEGLFAPESVAGLMYLEGWGKLLPPCPAFLLRRGFFRERQGAHEAARQDYEACLALDAVTPLLGLARLALAHNDAAAALSFARQALQSTPRDPEALLAVATLTRQLEGKAALARWIRSHVELAPACPERDWAIGEAHLAVADHKSAASAFRRAAGVPPAGPAALRLAQALLASGQLAASEKLANQLLEAQPESGLGVLLFDLAAGRDTTLELELTEESAHAALKQWVDALVASGERKLLRRVRERVGAVGALFPWLPDYLLRKSA
jgi:tetratricopeptide (TPR) repeat protein